MRPSLFLHLADPLTELKYVIFPATVNDLSLLHQEHLLPQFSDDASSDIVQQIEIKTAEITRVRMI